VITHDDHLLRIGQVDPDDRVARRHQDAQPTEPGVAIAVTPRHTTTVTHERPPYAWDTKPEAHREDVPSSGSDTQNVFLCRDVRAGEPSFWGRYVTFAVFSRTGAIWWLPTAASTDDSSR
jgi:hypothetical protein